MIHVMVSLYAACCDSHMNYEDYKALKTFTNASCDAEFLNKHAHILSTAQKETSTPERDKKCGIPFLMSHEPG